MKNLTSRWAAISVSAVLVLPLLLGSIVTIENADANWNTLTRVVSVLVVCLAIVALFAILYYRSQMSIITIGRVLTVFLFISGILMSIDPISDVFFFLKNHVGLGDFPKRYIISISYALACSAMVAIDAVMFFGGRKTSD